MKFAYIYFVILFLAACSREQADDAHSDHSAGIEQRYTCPMHPEIIKDQPGNCPICGMALIKVAAANDNSLMLSETQMRLANITTRRAGQGTVGETTELSGVLVVDEQRSESISVRIAGRIEKLFVKETGHVIRKGEPLYVLYSEELFTLQQEYLLAKEQYKAFPDKRYKSFLEASERKLLLYGLTRRQIERLSNGNIQPGITFTSPSSGVVTQINVAEGQYVGTGASLYKIEDLSTLWVEAELYANEVTLVKRGDKIKIAVAGSDEDLIDATVEFLSPEFKGNSQILLMRASIINTEQKFKPGQQVQVLVSNSSRVGIALPVDAIIRDGKGSHVYVQTGQNTFKPRRVETGVTGFDLVEITNGLLETDTVAISGAYLLYSELILKNGVHPLAALHH